MIRCGGWLASLAVTGVATTLLCSGTTQHCILGIVLFGLGLTLWHPLMKQEGGVPVLTYHSVTDDGSWFPWSENISVPPELFERNLESLKRMGCTVLRTDELVAARKTGRPLGERPVVIQFDDGYLDNWVAALPLLKRHRLPATVFVPVDFVEPGNELRPTLDDVDCGRLNAAELTWNGYLNWAELKAMRASGLIDVEAHGVGHGRVATGNETTGILTKENWRRHAWLQWRHMPGNKSHWYRGEYPPLAPLGAPVPRSASALAARSWSCEGLETQAAYEERVSTELRQAKRILENELDSTIRFFCWPFDETNDTARELALKAGYTATTGGEGENRSHEDPAIISRCHVGAGVLGRPCLLLDNFVFCARVRLFQGNYYWGFLVIPLDLVRRAREVFARLLVGGRAKT